MVTANPGADSLRAAADRLDADAGLPKNRRYANAFREAASHYRDFAAKSDRELAEQYGTDERDEELAALEHAEYAAGR